jgi:Lrp/AsnC family transcriptional regulator
MAKLDSTDYRILKALQEDCTLSSGQVAEMVGVSQSPTWRRMVNLDEVGAVKKRVAIVDRHVVGLNMMVYILVRLKDQTQNTVDAFCGAAENIPEIVQCMMLMGDIDFLLVVVTRDLDAFHDLLRTKISNIPGISGIDSRVVVEETKNTAALPLDGFIGAEKRRPKA